MSNKPTIAITGPERGGFTAWLFTWIAIKRAGGKPLRVRPSQIEDLPAFDGLIIGGGADINPELYDATPLNDLKELSDREKKRTGVRRFLHFTVGIFIVVLRKIFSLGHTAPVDADRDVLEKEILMRAIKSKKPVLGICRGAQFINVYHGGDLHQDIQDYYSEIPKVDTIYPKKDIIIKSNTRLADILGAGTVQVNSLHNQAVNKTGTHIIITAREETGVAQAIEHQSYPFMIGIQWHPEYLPQIDRQQKLFRSLVEYSKNSGTSPD